MSERPKYVVVNNEEDLKKFNALISLEHDGKPITVLEGLNKLWDEIDRLSKEVEELRGDSEVEHNRRRDDRCKLSTYPAWDVDIRLVKGKDCWHLYTQQGWYGNYESLVDATTAIHKMENL